MTSFPPHFLSAALCCISKVNLPQKLLHSSMEAKERLLFPAAKIKSAKIRNYSLPKHFYNILKSKDFFCELK
jgi:hypothetical protein